MGIDAKTQFLLSATGCTPDEANIAMEISEGDEEQALEMVELIRARYLVLKVYFTASGAKSLQGVFFVILDEKSIQPVCADALVINYSEDHIEINTDSDVLYWQQLILSNSKERSKYDIESSIELKEYIETRILPEPGSQIWSLAREMQGIKSLEDGANQSAERIKEIEKSTTSAVAKLLEKHYKQALNVFTGVDLLNKLRFSEIAKALNLTGHFEDEGDSDAENKGSDNKDQEKHEQSDKPITIDVRGKGVIDVTTGILTRDLKKGDKIAVNIIERTQLAENLGRMLGLKRQGYWLHVWGTIREIKNVDATQRVLKVEIAKNIFVHCSMMMEVRIKCMRQYPGGDRKEDYLESTTNVPGYLMVAGMLLFIGLLLKIFLIFINQ